MVISFSVTEARHELLNQGVVYTYRWHQRAFFKKEKGDIENTWANSGRGTKSIGNVQIEEVGQIEYDELHPYWTQSGFNKHWKWQGAVMGMMPFPGCETGFLYKVTLNSQQLRTEKQ